MLLPSLCNMKHAFIVTTKGLCEGWGVSLTRHCHHHATKVEKMQYVVIPFHDFFLSLNLLSASSLRNDQNFIDLFFFCLPLPSLFFFFSSSTATKVTMSEVCPEVPFFYFSSPLSLISHKSSNAARLCRTFFPSREATKFEMILP